MKTRRRARSAATDKWHVGGHDGGKEHIGRQGQVCHAHHGVHHALHVHPGLGLDAPVGLKDALCHGLCHVACDVADVNLTHCNLKSSAIQVGRFGEPRDGVLGGRVSDGGRSGCMG